MSEIVIPEKITNWINGEQRCAQGSEWLSKYKDPCPTVPMQAMSCGIPVIGSLSGGMPELLSDEGGALLEVPDVWDEMCYPGSEEMVEAVINILGKLASWRQMARQQAVGQFSKGHWLEPCRQIFTEVL